MRNGWQQQGERSNPLVLKFIIWVALHMGRGVARLFLVPVVLYFMVTSAKAIKASKYYLARVYKRRVSIFKVVKHIYYFSATILDRVYFITDQHYRYKVTIHNEEVLNRYIEQNRGCILLGTHLGSFEVLRTLALSKKKLPLKILMYRNHNKMISSLLDALNPEINDTVIDLGSDDALFQAQEALQNGYCVGMLGDRVAEGDRAIDCKLLGDKTAFPLGPLLLSSILKAPVVLFFGLYNGRNRYNVYFESLVDEISTDRTKRDHEVRNFTQQYVNRIEYYIKLAPYNWFNFFDYWNDYSR